LTDTAWAVVDASGLAPGATRALEIDGHRVLLCNVDGKIFAVRNVCPHQEFGLDDARLRGSVLECSLHGGRFDVRDGCPVRAPTKNALDTYPVRSGGPTVEIALPALPLPSL
jgi:3-phenylpropionate/trans-cinnamate dioxygenase ferredoxin subunit